MVARDDEKEGTEGLEVRELGALLPDFEKDFLGEVFSKLGEFDEFEDELGKRVLVLVEQEGESIRITGGEPGQQSLFLVWGECGQIFTVYRVMRG
jgi:hypothetical protein